MHAQLLVVAAACLHPLPSPRPPRPPSPHHYARHASTRLHRPRRPSQWLLAAAYGAGVHAACCVCELGLGLGLGQGLGQWQGLGLGLGLILEGVIWQQGEAVARRGAAVAAASLLPRSTTGALHHASLRGTQAWGSASSEGKVWRASSGV